MWDGHTNFPNFDRWRVQRVWSGCLSQHDRGIPGQLPNRPCSVAAVEDSDFFGRTLDDVVAWGLFFLHSAEVQLKLIEKVAAILPSGGRLLFTAPKYVTAAQRADALR